MHTRDLNRRQMENLKCAYLCETMENPSYGELASADTIVSDETIHHYYEGVVFSSDDLDY